MIRRAFDAHGQRRKNGDTLVLLIGISGRPSENAQGTKTSEARLRILEPLQTHTHTSMFKIAVMCSPNFAIHSTNTTTEQKNAT